MEAVVLIVHLLIAVSLIGVVLVQKSEGGGLGIGSSGGAGGGIPAAPSKPPLVAADVGDIWFTDEAEMIVRRVASR